MSIQRKSRRAWRLVGEAKTSYPKDATTIPLEGIHHAAKQGRYVNLMVANPRLPFNMGPTKYVGVARTGRYKRWSVK